MAVFYEWDIEEVATEDGETWGAEDIVEHFHQESYKCVKTFLKLHPAAPGYRYDVALVRDDDNGRSWAYMDDGVLPEFFEDAYQCRTAKVPKRFHAEVTKAG